MKEIALRPIHERSADYDEIEARIVTLFRKLIYIPVMRELTLGAEKVLNAREGSALGEAVHAGEVIYWQGEFTGAFSAPVSRELRALGATFDRSSRSYKIRKAQLPYEIRAAISGSEDRFTRQMGKIDDRLAQFLPAEIAQSLKVEALFDKALWRTDRALESTVKGITIAPKLTPEQASRISKEWERNIQLYIEDFTKAEIFKLRTDLKEAVFTGKRYESAVKTIQDSYGVSRRKARFLARQETSLLMTKFKQTRYEEAGVRYYKWGCVAGSKAHPVRPRHKELADDSLKGKLFRWDTPPNTAASGEPARYNNPGQDYNCRCYAIPIVRASDDGEDPKR